MRFESESGHPATPAGMSIESGDTNCLIPRFEKRLVLGLIGLTLVFGMVLSAGALDRENAPAPARARIAQYRIPDPAEEIALARSAAPAAISDNAEILILGDEGYDVAVKGKNGFVCLVERSWFASFDDPGFWNPRIRGPDCLNAAAVSTVLPANLERTRWAMAGASTAEMRARAKSSVAAQQVPATGSMGYMMSKQQHLSDTDGHWQPHLMFFLPRIALSAWGANLPGSPVQGQEGGPHEATIFFVPLDKWSDGSSASTHLH